MGEHERLEFFKARCYYLQREDADAQARLLERSYVKGSAAFERRVNETIRRLVVWHLDRLTMLEADLFHNIYVTSH